MTHLFIHNTFHNGDVILTRAIIQAIRESFSSVEITLECVENCVYLWRDLELPISVYQDGEYTGIEPTPNCPIDAVFINLWFGVYSDILKLYGMTYSNNVHTFNRQMYQHNIHHKYLLSVPIYTPMITFFGNSEQEFEVKGNSILVENGKALSNQNYFYLNEHLEQIASDFTSLNFYCSAKPSFTASNIFDCNELNLIELAHVSNKCIGFLMKGSAVNAATQTEINRYKPRCIVGWDLPMRVWDNLEEPTVYAESYTEVKAFLTEIAQDLAVSRTGVKATTKHKDSLKELSCQKALISNNNLLEKILIVSHKQERCGVYQYGVNITEALKKSKQYSFIYAECSSAEEFSAITSGVEPSAVIYNYHPSTMRWLQKEMMSRINVPHIGVIHEVTQQVADLASSEVFQRHIAPDPTLLLNNPIVFKTGRLIPPYINTHRLPEVPTIGSFGFGLEGKGFDQLISTVQHEFDKAVIRLHIPMSDFADPTGYLANATAKRCQGLVVKPGIKLILSHEFLTKNQLIDFLAQNTLNAFFYERYDGRGISSVIDYALAVQRPIAITKSSMFRHILSATPSICIEDLSLKQIINNGIAPLLSFQNDWSEANFILDYERIIDKVLQQEYSWYSKSVQQQPHVTFFNRILDNAARSQYKPVVDELFELVPDMMLRKIPEANIQQAFVVDTVQKFASQFISPKILCVGSFEDTAAAGLKHLGYRMEEIDPVLNYDLNTYFHKPSTIKGSYNIIFSTSVLEHVQDDELFVMQIAKLLAPGGTAILTCDYNDQYKLGDRLPQEDFRFYTQKDFMQRILPLLKNCSLVDAPQWDCPTPDFTYAGCHYTFATFVFQKNKLNLEVPNLVVDPTLLSLNLKDVNLIVFPDWSVLEEPLGLELEQVFKALVMHPDRSHMTLLINTSNITEEDANLILSSVMMNLLMQEDLKDSDVDTGLEISLVGSLSAMQWQTLLPHISARIVLEHENQQAIIRSNAESLPFLSQLQINSQLQISDRSAPIVL